MLAGRAAIAENDHFSSQVRLRKQCDGGAGGAVKGSCSVVCSIGDRADLDPRPGGVFFLGMGQVTARGTYLTVKPPRRVRFSWGVPSSPTLPPGGSVVEVVLTPDGDSRMVVLTHRGLQTADIGSHHVGWDHQLSLLRTTATP